MSAKRAVTIFRSPASRFSLVRAPETLEDDPELRRRLGRDPAPARRSGEPRFPPSGRPHSPQNLSPGSMGAPQCGHEATSGVPQVVQNLRPSRLSLLHCEQRILPHSGGDGFAR